jgi:hypothetical protein
VPALKTCKPPFQVVAKSAKGAQGVDAMAKVPLMPGQKVVHKELKDRYSLSGQGGLADQYLSQRSGAGIQFIVCSGFAGLVQRALSGEAQVDGKSFE